MTTISSREFNQDVGGAKRAAERGPVFITDRGRPAHVLLTIEEYHRIHRTKTNIVDMLSMPEAGSVDLDLPLRPADLRRVKL